MWSFIFTDNTSSTHYFSSFRTEPLFYSGIPTMVSREIDLKPPTPVGLRVISITLWITFRKAQVNQFGNRKKGSPLGASRTIHSPKNKQVSRLHVSLVGCTFLLWFLGKYIFARLCLHINCALLRAKDCLTSPFIPSTVPNAQWLPDGVLLNKAQVAIPAKDCSFEPQALPTALDSDFSKALAIHLPEVPSLAKKNIRLFLPWIYEPPAKRIHAAEIAREKRKKTRGGSGSFGDTPDRYPLAPHPFHPLHLLNIQDIALGGFWGYHLGPRDRSRAACIRLLPGPAAENPVALSERQRKNALPQAKTLRV